MHNHPRFSPQSPEILDPYDLAVMRGAIGIVHERIIRSGRSVETEAVANLVLRFYQQGLLEPEKLADLAVLYVQSKLLRERTTS